MKKENFESALTDIDDKYLTEASGQSDTRRRVSKKWKLLPIAAALMLAVALGVNAAAPVDLGFYLKAAFGGGYEMLSSETDGHDITTTVKDNVTYRSSGDEIRMELNGIIGSDKNVYIYVNLTVGPNVAVPKKNFKLDFELDVFGLQSLQNGLSHGFGYTVLSRIPHEDGSETLVCKITTFQAKDPQNTPCVLSCSGITIWDEGQYGTSARKLVSGEWNLGFTLNYKPMSTWWPMAQELTGSGSALDGLTVTSVICTPSAICIRYTADPSSPAIRYFMQLPSEAFKVILNDGTEITGRSLAAIGQPADGRNYLIKGSGVGVRSTDGSAFNGSLSLLFSYSFDTSQIASVVIEGYEIPIQ